MLDSWIDIARGPLLILSLLVMAVGLLRVAILQAWELGWAYSRAGDQVVSWPVIAKRTLSWLLPWRYWGPEARRLYNVISLVFHVGIILVPLFLAGHVAIVYQELGLRWASLPPLAADILTVLTILAVVGLLIGRAAHSGTRVLSKTEDWLLPVLCVVPFLLGFLVAHPQWSPIDPRVAYLLHLLSAELLLILVPFTKLSHMVLFWSNRATGELGWRFAPGAGARIRATLHKEGQGV